MMLTIVGLSQGMLRGVAGARQRGIGADIIVRPRGLERPELQLGAHARKESRLGGKGSAACDAWPRASMIQPLGGISTMTGIDLEAFLRLSGPFRFRAGRAFQGDRDSHRRPLLREAE